MKSKKFSHSYSSPAVTPPAPLPPTHDEIAALAHAIWLERGQPVGCDLEHWLEAERQLNATAQPLSTEERVDPDTAPAGEVDRELERIVSPPPPRSPTSL